MSTVLETAAEAPPKEDHSDFMLISGGAVVLSGISWKMYRRLRRMSENRNTRMTYDRGELEIMSPSRAHEVIAAFLGTLIDVWAIELDIAIVCCRTMTIRRSDLDRGFEPDNCYYVQHELQMREEKKINLKTAPPPDLAIEVEVTRELGKKVTLYAAFGIPELWCWRRNELKVFELSQDGEYVARETSICFPTFPVAKAQEIVQQFGTASRTSLARLFRNWVRDNMQPQ